MSTIIRVPFFLVSISRAIAPGISFENERDFRKKSVLSRDEGRCIHSKLKNTGVPRKCCFYPVFLPSFFYPRPRMVFRATAARRCVYSNVAMIYSRHNPRNGKPRNNYFTARFIRVIFSRSLFLSLFYERAIDNTAATATRRNKKCKVSF